jgi:hypothetical protein
MHFDRKLRNRLASASRIYKKVSILVGAGTLQVMDCLEAGIKKGTTSGVKSFLK